MPTPAGVMPVFSVSNPQYTTIRNGLVAQALMANRDVEGIIVKTPREGEGSATMIKFMPNVQDKSLARVNVHFGILVFSDCTPATNYHGIGKVKSAAALSSNYPYLRDKLCKKASGKKKKGVQGVIAHMVDQGVDYAEMIAFDHVFGGGAVAHSQDILVTKDARKIEAKVLETSDDEVRYKKFSNLNGPTYVEKKSNIATIIYANGDVEAVSASQNSGTNTLSSMQDRSQSQEKAAQPLTEPTTKTPAPGENDVPTSIEPEGVKVYTAGRDIYDKIYLENRTGSPVKIVLKGLHSKMGTVEIGRCTLAQGGKMELNNIYEGRLKMFSYMTVAGMESVRITRCTAYASHYNVHIVIEKTGAATTPIQTQSQGGDKSPQVDVDVQLQKLKHWLDNGIITQDEFLSKRKELIGF